MCLQSVIYFVLGTVETSTKVQLKYYNTLYYYVYFTDDAAIIA